MTAPASPTALASIGTPGTTKLTGAAPQALVAGDKGLLAIDESVPTCNARFARLGIARDQQARRACRELIMTTPRLGGRISGAILCDETFRQRTTRGVAFPAVLAAVGMLAGIKVDLGAKPMAAVNDPSGSPLPWPVAFSFGRAIQLPALTIWAGQHTNIARAQHALIERATCNQDARRGRYTPIGAEGSRATVAAPRQPARATTHLEQADTP